MSTPRIGLVLGGGGARGLGHVAVLQALDDLGLRPVAIAGASIGAIVGAGIAAGMTGSEMREAFLDVFGSRANAVAKLWQLRPKKLTDLIARDSFGIGKVDAERVLEIFAGDRIPARFSDLLIPFAVSTTDFYGGCEIRLSSGDLPRAVAASMAMPGIFKPVMIDGRPMVDGGVMNPVPIDALPEDIDISIAVDVVSFPEPRADRVMPTGLETVFGAAQLMMQQIMAAKLERRAPDLLVRPPIGDFHVMDFLRARQILAACEPVREDVKRRLTRLIEARDGDRGMLESTQVRLPVR